LICIKRYLITKEKVKPFITTVQREMDIIVECGDTVVNLFDADSLDGIRQSSSLLLTDIFYHG
jgi:hypothetical protein